MYKIFLIYPLKEPDSERVIDHFIVRDIKTNIDDNFLTLDSNNKTNFKGKIIIPITNIKAIIEVDE